MQPRILRTEDAAFLAGAFDGKNTSGFRPLGDNIIILPDVASEKIGKHGLITATPDHVTRQSLAAETGVIVELGDGAFFWNNDRSRPYEGTKPRPGDRVVFEGYDGRIGSGRDGQNYRIMSDTCLAAVEIAGE